MDKHHRLIVDQPRERSWIVEILLALCGGLIVYLLSSRFDFMEKAVEFSRSHEAWEVDELITVAVFFAIVSVLFSVRRLRESRVANQRLRSSNDDLQSAMSEIKQLRGIIPICVRCKSIKDSDGYWHEVESYVRDHSEAEFSHGICMSCTTVLYPEFADELADDAESGTG